MPTCTNVSSVNSSTANVIAWARSGNNASGGAWEYSVDSVYGQYPWGHDGSGNLDNGNGTAVELVVSPNGGANSVAWTVGTGSALTAASTAFSYITQLGLEAYVDGNANYGTELVQWVTVTVTFYDANNVGTAYAVTCLPQANSPAGSGQSLIQYALITPDDNLQVRVVVEASLKFHAGVPTPGQLSLIAKIFVWTS